MAFSITPDGVLSIDGIVVATIAVDRDITMPHWSKEGTVRHLELLAQGLSVHRAGSVTDDVLNVRMAASSGRTMSEEQYAEEYRSDVEPAEAFEARRAAYLASLDAEGIR
jgi:hypothetical protein